MACVCGPKSNVRFCIKASTSRICDIALLNATALVAAKPGGCFYCLASSVSATLVATFRSCFASFILCKFAPITARRSHTLSKLNHLVPKLVQLHQTFRTLDPYEASLEFFWIYIVCCIYETGLDVYPKLVWRAYV